MRAHTTRILAWALTGLAASTADGQVTFATDSTEANLRWAANSLTTNGAMRSRRVVVVSFVDGGAGMAAVVEQARGSIAPVVSLYVNDFNAAARAVYERVGFRRVGTFATVLL